MIELFKTYIIEQWRLVFVTAPIPFLMAFIVACLVIWLIFDWGYGRENSFLKTQLAEYRDKLKGATPTEVQATIAALQTEVERLKQRSAARRLSPSERAAFHAIGTGRPYTVRLAWDAGCGECEGYAADFKDAFAVIGWKVVTWALPDRAPSNSGVAVQLGDTRAGLSKAATLVTEAFRRANMAVDDRPGEIPNDADVGILITPAVLRRS